jgi:hypothetical protein
MQVLEISLWIGSWIISGTEKFENILEQYENVVQRGHPTHEASPALCAINAIFCDCCRLKKWSWRRVGGI